jgi:single-stranded-DNA-specific exonuclease
MHPDPKHDTSAWKERPRQGRVSDASLHPVLADVYARRGVEAIDELDYRLQGLLPPERLLHAREAGEILAEAIVRNTRIVIVGDFDADGATSSALAVKALRAFGATAVQFKVPDRVRDGYGLTPAIADEVAAMGGELLITVDNGISSIEGVARANALGLRVLVTDHHLPGATLPAALCIVNPNQPGCGFPSKHLAGVGVMFYVLMMTRTVLRERGHSGAGCNLAQFLDLVALGTVADVVVLDRNNRILVHQGLQRIRAGQGCAGINALLLIAKRDRRFLAAADLGFAVGPRINAAGRLDDMTHGVLCLLTESEREAMTLASELDALNHERRAIEAEMLASAEALMNGIHVNGAFLPDALALHEPDWHQGVIGILAGRLKDRYHRPTICFADAGDGVLKGSGRSIPGLHLRDVLALLAAEQPELLVRFGGHAMAAGLTIAARDFSRFQQAFTAAVSRQVDAELLERQHWHDGELPEAHWELATAEALEAGGPWGQHFAEPRFLVSGTVANVLNRGERICKFVLQGETGKRMTAVLFDQRQFDRVQTGTRIQALFALDINRFRDNVELQARIEQLHP